MDQISAKPLDARVVRSRARLQAALMQLLAQRRLEDISIADIVAAAAVGYATFFRHYTDKQALWIALADALIDAIGEKMTPRFASGDHGGAARAICALINDNRDAYRILFTGGAAAQAREAMLEKAQAIAAKESLHQSSALPASLGSHFAVNAMFGILAWWLSREDEIAPVVIADAIDRLVYSPLLEG